MEQLADSFPDRVVRFELPRPSRRGQRIWGLEISHHAKASSGKPVFLMTGLHHGDEWATVELTMEFVHDVLKNDGVDTVITSLLDKVRFVVVPIVNPDGFERLRRSNCRGQECAEGVDLNRNYGAFWKRGGEAPFSEPESQNIRDLMWSNQVTVSVNNHTYASVMVQRAPFASEAPSPADVVRYDSLAQVLGQALKGRAGPAREIIYTANGTMDETAYYSAGTFAFTFEFEDWAQDSSAYAGVINQYWGTGEHAGSSAREGFLRLFAAAATPTLHSVLSVKAPPGATLTIQKKFTMETAPILKADSTVGPPLVFPVMLTSSLTVPRGASEVTWHVNPSSRPSQHAQELLPGTWTLTCTQKNGRPQTAEVAVARGEATTVDMRQCR